MAIGLPLCYTQLSKADPTRAGFSSTGPIRSLAPYMEGYVALEQVAAGQLEPRTEHYGLGSMRRGVWWQSAMGTTESGDG